MSTTTIRIDVPSSSQAFAYKEQLLEDGLVWSQDFTWRYTPGDSNWDYDLQTSAWVEFTFAKESVATYYRMKWIV